MIKIYPIRLVAAVVLLSLGALGAANAQSPFDGPQLSSRGQAPAGTRLPPTEAGQEHTARAGKSTQGLRGPMQNVQRAHAATPSTGAVRPPQDALPVAQRTALPARPHATDPDLPRQVTSRSAPRDLRAPTGLAGPGGEAWMRATPEGTGQRAPRMTVSQDTRTTRASFEDWLFGR